MEPGIFPEVRLFLIVTEEYTQGVQALCDPRAKREGSSGRYRTPSGGERVCGRFSEGVTRDVTGERIGVYHRPKIGE
jgi:hypothetical protein